MKETNQKNQATEMTNGDTRRIVTRLDELCEGVPENEFDSWLRKRFYPVLAVGNLGVDGGSYKRRLEELCSGEAENEFDAWLRERFYPVVALFTA